MHRHRRSLEAMEADGTISSTLALLALVNERWVWRLQHLAISGDLLEVPSGGCTL